MSAPEASSADGQALEQLALKYLTGHRHRLIRAAAQSGVLGAAGWKGYKRAEKWWTTRRLYTVAVADTDPVYRELHGWVLDQLPEDDRRSLTVATSSRRSGGDMPIDESGRPEKARLQLIYDGSRDAHLMLDGHRIKVSVEQTSGGGVKGESWFPEPDKLRFTARSAAGRDAVLAVIARLAEPEAKRVARLYTARWESWYARNDLPLRSLDTVILPAGMAEELVDDLGRFLAAEDRYARLGTPWHRGYLLEGPPGTGKSSLARALASHFNLDVYYASLSDTKTDGSLMQLVSQLPGRAMLLIEDIDTLHAATSRDDESGQATASALLNALDGIITPHGLITVMTTNDVASLDPALVRPGRADRIVRVGYLDDEQLARLAALIAGEPLDLPPLGDTQITAARVVEAVKPWLDRPEALAEQVPLAVKELIAG